MQHGVDVGSWPATRGLSPGGRSGSTSWPAGWAGGSAASGWSSTGRTSPATRRCTGPAGRCHSWTGGSWRCWSGGWRRRSQQEPAGTSERRWHQRTQLQQQQHRHRTVSPDSSSQVYLWDSDVYCFKVISCSCAVNSLVQLFVLLFGKESGLKNKEKENKFYLLWFHTCRPVELFIC